MNKNNLNKKAFSIIEIMIGIFIFTLWLVSIYWVIVSTLKLNDYNENYIVATNLAREQIELVRNIRDSNYKKIKPYNLMDPKWNSFNSEDKFEIWKKYKIENKMSLNNFPIKVDEISDFWEWKSELNWKMQKYRLCLDWNKYVYCEWTNWLENTAFYKFIEVKEVTGISKALKINSKVIWYIRWYHEFEVSSILADWKRL